jgi:hypothetical protein
MDSRLRGNDGAQRKGVGQAKSGNEKYFDASNVMCRHLFNIVHI